MHMYMYKYNVWGGRGHLEGFALFPTDDDISLVESTNLRLDARAACKPFIVLPSFRVPGRKVWGEGVKGGGEKEGEGRKAKAKEKLYFVK
jgi:hypothetical protein